MLKKNVCYLIVYFIASSLFAVRDVIIEGEIYETDAEEGFLNDVIAQLSGLAFDAKIAHLFAMELIRQPQTKEQKIEDFKRRYILAYQINRTHQDLEPEGKQLGLSEPDFGIFEREAYQSQVQAQNVQRQVQAQHVMSTTNSLAVLAERANAQTVVFLDGDDTTIYRNGDGDVFSPVEPQTVHYISEMRRKGAKVLFLTSRGYDSIQEIAGRFYQAGIDYARDRYGLFEGLLGERIQAAGSASVAGSYAGIIAASGGFTKGEVMRMIIEKSPAYFSSINTILFADDAKSNCKSVHQVLSTSRFNSYTFHFTNIGYLFALHPADRQYQFAEIRPADERELAGMQRLGFRGDVSEYRKLVSEAALLRMPPEAYLAVLNSAPVVAEQPQQHVVETVECAVCFEESNAVCATACNKDVCLECLKHNCLGMVAEQGISFDVEKNSFEIACPGCGKQDCRYSLSKEHAKEFLGREKYEDLKERASRNMESFKGCPHAGCCAQYFKDDALSAQRDGCKYLTCEGCKKRICLACEGPYAEGHVCSAQKILQIEFNDKIKPCPNPDCNCVLEKNGGCLTMVCGGNPENAAQPIAAGHCGAKFCWPCGTWMPYQPGVNQSLLDPRAETYSAKTKTRCVHGGMNAYHCNAASQAWWKKE